MRFRNPKTGEVYTGEALAIAWLRFCLERNDKWVKDNPREAARLMGYEVVEEKYDSSGTCGICEKSTPNGYDGDIVCSITGESGKSEDKCKLREANMDKPLNDQTAKADTGKLQISLVPTQIIRDIAEVRMYGNNKYHDPDNWKTVELQRYIDALLRHTLAFVDDIDSVDAESGIPHYRHMACNMAFICEMMRWK